MHIYVTAIDHMHYAVRYCNQLHNNYQKCVFHCFLFYLGAGVWSQLGSSGASSAGLGGKGGCGSFTTCRLKRELPYGDLYTPTDYGSGGAVYNGGTGN